MTNSGLTSALMLLVQSITRTAKDGISDGTLKTEFERYEQFKVEKFKYSDEGITELSARGNTVFVRSWFRATVTLLERIKQLPEYATAARMLSNMFGEENSRHIESFANKVVHRCLYESAFEASAFEILVTDFLKNLRHEPVRYGAHVSLEGIVLRPDRFQINSQTALRKPTIEDLEQPIPEHSKIGWRGLGPIPTAFLEFEFLGREARETQTKIEQAVAILRLFKVGSVKHLSYQMFSDSITDIMASGTLISGSTGAAYEKYLLTPEDAARLGRFWETAIKSIPQAFFDSALKGTDPVTIAYKRYCDALLNDGIIERRITNSVMGLEALIAKPTGEMQELRYRISTRASKVLGLFGYNQYEVRDTVKDAYRIRSIFAHGGQLTSEQKRRLESRYKDMKRILLTLLEYLRVTLLIMMLVAKRKNEFIDLIDDSLIDPAKEEQINSSVSWMRNIII